MDIDEDVVVEKETNETTTEKSESKLSFSIDNLLSDKYKSFKEVKTETSSNNVSSVHDNNEDMSDIDDDNEDAVDDKSDHSENVDVESGSTMSLDGFDNGEFKSQAGNYRSVLFLFLMLN